MKMKNHFTHAITAVFLLGLLTASCAGPGAMQSSPGGAVYGEQGVKGTLTFQGKPLKDAYVYAYRSYSTNLLGPADFASNPSAADGSFTVELVEGAYYIVARKRASGDNTGPITKGDYYTVNPGNPVIVKPGGYASVDLELAKMADPMFLQATSRQESNTGVRGTIVDEEGKPVAWVFAMLYKDDDMKRIPDFTSVMTSTSGEFVVYVPSGGKYWLAARKNFRERPVVGEPYGLYKGTQDYSIQVPNGGFVEGVTITLQPYRKGIQN